jgi:sigma-E factor negative regulatory protein RseA
MNKAETGNPMRADSTMMTKNDENYRDELLSALADGELEGEELATALALASSEECQASWQLYHLVGDVLRTPELARPADTAFLARLRTELNKVPQPAPVNILVDAPSSAVAVAPAQLPAANADVFRWKMVAGFASMAAVAAIGWSSLASLQGGGALPAGAQLAAAPAVTLQVAQTAPPNSVIAVADANGQSVMLRDPRLDELLAAHKQFGSTSALQMPAGFLRNATFEAPSR